MNRSQKDTSALLRRRVSALGSDATIDFVGAALRHAERSCHCIGGTEISRHGSTTWVSGIRIRTRPQYQASATR